MNLIKRCTMIVLDGCDGVGKETQSKLLKERFEKMGKKVLLLAYPNYKSESAALVNAYLNNRLEIPVPQHRTCAYAIDRAITMSRPEIVEVLEDPNAVIICDRYSSAAMIFDTVDTPDEMFKHHIMESEAMEFGMLKIPRPDINLLLHLDFSFVKKILDERKANDSTDKHESNYDLLERVGNNILRFHQLHDFSVLRCGTEGKERLTIEEVHELIWSALRIEKII